MRRIHARDKYAPPDVEELLTDAKTYQLTLLAHYEKGISLEVIRRNFGENGLRKIEYFLKKGVMVKKKGRIYLKNKLNADLTISDEATHELMKNLITHSLNPDRLGDEEKPNTMFTHVFWVDPESKAIKEEAHDATAEYIERMFKIYKSAPGAEPRFFALAQDFLFPFPLHSVEEDDTNEDGGDNQ